MTKRLSQKSKAFCWTLGSWINHTLCISKKLVNFNFNTIFPGESIAASHGMIYIYIYRMCPCIQGKLAASCNIRKNGSKMVDGPTCFEDHRLELIWNTAVHNGTVPAAKRHRGTVRAKQSETERNCQKGLLEPMIGELEKRRVFATNLYMKTLTSHMALWRDEGGSSFNLFFQKGCPLSPVPLHVGFLALMRATPANWADLPNYPNLPIFSIHAILPGKVVNCANQKALLAQTKLSREGIK